MAHGGNGHEIREIQVEVERSRIMRNVIAFTVICAAASGAPAGYDQEYWDVPALGNNDWTY